MTKTHTTKGAINVNETRIVKLADKGETKRVKWLLKGASKPSSGRPALEGISVKNGASCTTDGYRLFASTTPEAFASEALIRIESLPATSTVAEISTMDETFPDVLAILPKGDPTFSINLDANLLRDALDACSGRDLHDRIVTLRFYDGHAPFEMLGKMQGAPVYALIMPCRKDDKPTHTWRPGE